MTQRPVRYTPPTSKSTWTDEDTENVVIAGGCCLLTLFWIGATVGPYLAWLGSYLLWGNHADLTSQWNFWNIWLVFIVVLQAIGGYCKKASGK